MTELRRSLTGMTAPILGVFTVALIALSFIIWTAVAYAVLG